MLRTRSKSEAELSLLKTHEIKPIVAESDVESPSPSTPTTPSKHAARDARAARKSYHPPSNMVRRHASSGNGEERWVYKGRAELVDLEVIVSPPREDGEERRFEILSPEGSFVLYAGKHILCVFVNLLMCVYQRRKRKGTNGVPSFGRPSHNS